MTSIVHFRCPAFTGGTAGARSGRAPSLWARARGGVCGLSAVALLFASQAAFAAAAPAHAEPTDHAASTNVGAATAVTPQSAQPRLATPVPALSMNATHARMPTTAEPGVILPGGRRQSLTFAELGARDPLQLRGVEGENGIAFSVRSDEVVTAAVLHLVYTYSPALLPDLSQMKVLINGEVAATLPLPREQAGIEVARDIVLDPRFITEFNHVNVQLIGHYTTACEDPAHSSLWATVSNKSALDMTYASLSSADDLAALPRPFFDRRDVRQLELPFVFAGKPDAKALQAAGVVASWFGAKAGYRGARFPVQIGNLPVSGNAVVFAVSDSAIDGVVIPPVAGPTVAIVDRTPPSSGKLLLVLGRNAGELETAASAIGLGEPALSGPSALITQAAAHSPRVPYDAPNWLPSTRPVHFGELAEERDLTVTGYSAPPVRLNLRIPPDLFLWHSKGVPIDLRYRYSVRPTRDRSSLNVSIDNNFIDALPIPAQPTSMLDPARYWNQVMPDGTEEGHRRLFIPSLAVTPRAQLLLHFFYDIPNTGQCHGRLIQNVVGAVDPDSTIDLTSFPHYMALPDLAAFANSGFPFTRLADLSQTAVVLPKHADAGVFSLYLLEMGRMGASTGYPVTGVSVADADDVDRFADKDLLILGAPGQQPLLTRWAKSMPLSANGNTRTFEVSDVAYKVEDWWHGAHGVERSPARADVSFVSRDGNAIVAGFRSPLNKDRSAVALIGAPGQSDADLSDALLDEGVVPKLQGAVAVIHGREVTVTSNGDIYYVGHLSPQEYLRWALSRHPLLLLLGGVLAALVLAALFYRMLRAIAARRLGD